ncbi:host attachment family protein [Acidimangrovimonas sediminis]|uniref:host attachment family protein n=1 Tax=Acidimangrovimonas sediminis TaxID=2056283 RepID=UPI000C7FF3EB|nr:host attachment family protein [Acidimangrovimonas sediminis]
MTLLKNGTWLLVADGEKALLMENIGDEDLPVLEVRRKDQQVNPPDHEQGANRPGRKADNGFGQRSAMDDTDWHELAKERFADDLAQILYLRAHRGDFDRIVLVAAPSILGEMRRKLHKEVSERVIGEVPKTLTNHETDRIGHIVKDALAEAA